MGGEAEGPTQFAGRQSYPIGGSNCNSCILSDRPPVVWEGLHENAQEQHATVTRWVRPLRAIFDGQGAGYDAGGEKSRESHRAFD